MLVLTREPFQKLFLGKAGDVLTGPIVISIASIRGNEVRIAVDAQRDVDIVRDDVRFQPTAGVDVPKPKPVTTTNDRGESD